MISQEKEKRLHHKKACPFPVLSRFVLRAFWGPGPLFHCFTGLPATLPNLKPHFGLQSAPEAPPFLPAMARSWAHFASKTLRHGGLRDMSRFLPMAFLAAETLTLSTVTWGFDPLGHHPGGAQQFFRKGDTRGRRQHNPQQLIKQLFLLTSGGKLYPQDEKKAILAYRIQRPYKK